VQRATAIMCRQNKYARRMAMDESKRIVLLELALEIAAKEKYSEDAYGDYEGVIKAQTRNWRIKALGQIKAAERHDEEDGSEQATKS